jgi:type IV secretory pathway VirB6-like protein
MPFWKQMLLGVLVCFFPAEALAQTLQCDMFGQPVFGTSLFGGLVVNLNPRCTVDASHVFSGLNCMFHVLLNEVMSKMYCGLQYRLQPLLAQALTLYVLLYAIAFTMGISELTVRELVTRLLKIALIWTFAMNASWGVGLAFGFFVGGIESISGWLLGGSGSSSFFTTLDDFLVNQITSPFTADGAKIVAFFVSLWYAIPPLCLLFLYFMFKVMTVMIRALVSYLLGLTMIAFLIALSPIFVSFALFQFTFHFFETWLRYIISMAMQIVLVFAAVAVWLFVMQQYAYFFADLADIIIAYTKTFIVGGARTAPDTLGVCPIRLNGMRAACSGGEILPPTTFSQNVTLIWFLVSNLITLSVVVYAFDVFIKQIPDFARQLAGPQHVPALGGGSGASSVAMPGFSTVRKLENAAISKVQDSVGGIVDKFKQQANKLVT